MRMREAEKRWIEQIEFEKRQGGTTCQSCWMLGEVYQELVRERARSTATLDVEALAEAVRRTARPMKATRIKTRVDVRRYSFRDRYRRERFHWASTRNMVGPWVAERRLMEALYWRGRWDAIESLYTEPSWAEVRAEGISETDLRMLAGDR